MAEQAIDTSQIPNFAALNEWIEKLSQWCKESYEENERDSERIAALEDNLHLAESRIEEIEWMAERLEELMELLNDVGRGVRDMVEVTAWIKVKGL